MVILISLACNLTPIKIAKGTIWVCRDDDTTCSLKRAARLYWEFRKEGEEVRILATARESPNEGDTLMCQAMEDYLVLQENIPIEHIIAKPGDTWNTRGEIKCAVGIIQRLNLPCPKPMRVIVCGRWFHAPRAWLITKLVMRHRVMPPIPVGMSLTESRAKLREYPGIILHEILGALAALWAYRSLNL